MKQRRYFKLIRTARLLT